MLKRLVQVLQGHLLLGKVCFFGIVIGSFLFALKYAVSIKLLALCAAVLGVVGIFAQAYYKAAEEKSKYSPLIGVLYAIMVFFSGVAGNMLNDFFNQSSADTPADTCDYYAYHVSPMNVITACQEAVHTHDIPGLKKLAETSPEAAAEMGLYYKNMDDLKQASGYIEKAAIGGSAHGMRLYGEEFILDNQQSEAMKWIKKASDAGDKKARVYMSQFR